MAFTEADFQTDVAYNLGEDSPDTTTKALRLNLLNQKARLAYGSRNWNILRTFIEDNASYKTTASQKYVVLPADFTPNSLSSGFWIQNDDTNYIKYDIVDAFDKDNHTGYVAWVSFDAATNRWRINFNTTPDGAHYVRFQYMAAPSSIASNGTIYDFFYDFLVAAVTAECFRLNDDDRQDQWDNVANMWMQQMIQDDSQGDPAQVRIINMRGYRR